MKTKTRVYLLKRKVRKVFTPEIRKALLYIFFSLMITIAMVGLSSLGYLVGYSNGTNDLVQRHETDIPMCAKRNTEIRENPTGYILSKINQNDVVWVVQLQVPFAVVWYFDGYNWYLGTTTASVLVPCDMIIKDNLFS